MDPLNVQIGYVFGIFIIIVLIITIIFFIVSQVKKKSDNCNTNNVINSPFPKLRSIDSSPNYDYLLRDYYIKSSYNSCAGGQFENDWVDTCSLVAVIREGCRLLDFEVYNVNGVAGIAVSPTNSNYEKGTYNYVTFDEAMEVISTNAFSGSSCPNPNDPLFINIRIQSKDVPIYDSISVSLTQRLQNKLLSKDYSYENNGYNLGAVPVKTLLGKVCVIVDKINPLVETTKLHEFVNIGGNSVFLRNLNYNDVIYTNDIEELEYFNKKNLMITSPNKSKTADNYKAVVPMQYGAQFNAMCFQTKDSNLAAYKQLFEDVGYAFILKPIRMRWIPVTLDPVVDTPVLKEQTYTSQNANLVAKV